MNTASQPDTPSEWSKFSPLPPRLRNLVAPASGEPTAAADPSSAAISTLSTTTESPIETVADPSDDGLVAPALSGNVLEHLPEHFLCHNRKCEERRERRNLTSRHLFTALWRPMKLGKRRTLVLELTVTCPDCGFEHHATLVPPEWQETPK